MEDTQIIVVNMPKFSLRALRRHRRVDSGKSSPSCCLQSLTRPVVTLRVHLPWQGFLLAKQLLLSEDKQLKLYALGGIGFTLVFSALSFFLLLFMKRFLIMWFYSVFERKAAGVTKLNQGADTSSPTWASFCPRCQRPCPICGKERARQVLIIFCIPTTAFSCIRYLMQFKNRLWR